MRDFIVLTFSFHIRVVLFPELVKAVKRNERAFKLPYAVVRMTDHLANNPDKYFKGVISKPKYFVTNLI